MKKSPGRKQLRRLTKGNKKRGDLSRTRTHKMRSKTGMFQGENK